MSTQFDVIIIGAGPAGLGVASSLLEQGVSNVLILERESHAGGVPRHCQHPTFGLQSFKRPMKGHVWVEKLLSKLQGKCEIRTHTTVVKLGEGGVVQVSSPEGMETLYGKRVVLATGVRETPRHPRFVSGSRPQGILTTGALQQFVYLKGTLPVQNPIIMGTELVSFSALWTLRHAGVKPVAMVEQNDKISVWNPVKWFAKILGVPLLTNTKLESIQGHERVESVALSSHGRTHSLTCDGIIFSGKFVGDTPLVRDSHLKHKQPSGVPEHDQFGRCSDRTYFVAGNMLHPADMGDQCYLEGREKGLYIVKDLLQGLAVDGNICEIELAPTSEVVMTSPTFISKANQKIDLNIRFQKHFAGEVCVKANQKVIHRQTVRTIPERRVILKGIPVPEGCSSIEITH